MDYIEEYKKQYKKENGDAELRIRKARQYYYEQLSKAKTDIIIGVIMVLFGVLMFWLYFAGGAEDGTAGIFLLAILFLILGGVVIAHASSRTKEANERLSEVAFDLESVEQSIVIEKAKLAKQKELMEEQHKYDHPECPVCLSRNTRRISTLNRAVMDSIGSLLSD